MINIHKHASLLSQVISNSNSLKLVWILIFILSNMRHTHIIIIFFFSNSLYPQLTRSILIIVNQNLLDINATNIHHHYHKIFSKLIWFLIFHMAGMMHTRVNIIFANNFPNSVNDHSFFSNSFFLKFWDQIVNSKDYIH